MAKQHFRTIWISDTHLGNKNAQAQHLADYLENTTSDYLFLLGDIVDLWKMSTKGHWPKAHQQVLRVIFEKAKQGTEVIYVPGNHDPFFRDFNGMGIGHVSIHQEYIHTTVDGKKLLLIHGDRFDEDIHCGKILFRIADFAYETIVTANRHLNNLRRSFGLPYWSLSNALKMKSKKVRSYIEKFEKSCVEYAKENGVDGIVAGHIHQAKLKTIDGIIYANDGDWIESCSTLVEHEDGSLQLLNWAVQEELSPRFQTA